MSSDAGGSATFIILCFTVVIIGFGLLMIFAHDLMWEMTSWNNSWKGLQSERTEGWEAGQTISGIVMVVIGAGFGCWALSMSSAQAQRQASNDAYETAVVVTAAAARDELEIFFTPLISAWQADESTGVTKVNVTDVRADAIYYGRCDSGYFYVIIRQFNYEAYNDFAYVPDSNPESCKPQGLDLSFMSRPISLGNGWWSIQINTYNTEDEIITPTPSRTPQPSRTPVPSRTPIPTPTVATSTPNATQLQATIDAAVQAQMTQAISQQELAITQTIGAAVQGTLTAAAQPSATP